MTSVHCLFVNRFFDSLGKKYFRGLLLSNATRRRVTIFSLFSWTPVPLFFSPCLMLPNLHLNMAEKFFPCSSALFRMRLVHYGKKYQFGLPGGRILENSYSQSTLKSLASNVRAESPLMYTNWKHTLPYKFKVSTAVLCCLDEMFSINLFPKRSVSSNWKLNLFYSCNCKTYKRISLYYRAFVFSVWIEKRNSRIFSSLE